MLAREQHSPDAGDTLIEVLIALVVLGVAVVAMLLAFGAALTGSGEHRTLTNIASAQKTVTQQIVAQLQNANPPLYVACATGSTYQAVAFTDLQPGYTAKISGVSLWDPTDSAFDATQAQCAASLLSSNNQSAPQLISATVSYPSGGSSVVTTVVNNPTPPSPPPPGAANNLSFYHQPGGAQAAQPLTPQPVIEIQNAVGQPVTNDLSTIVLTLMNATGSAPATGATLSGCLGSPSGGYVTFQGCSVDKLGTYKLQATDSALPTGYVLQSNPFTITTGAASKISFTQAPNNAAGGAAFTSQPIISVEDAGGNLITSDASSVSLAVTTGPGSLTCNTNPVAVSGGNATFSGCSVNTKGTYTLTATDVEPTGTLTATSASFTIATGGAAKLVFTTSPGAQTSAITFPTASQPVVTVEDAGGNTVNSNASVTLALGTHPTGTPTFSCTSTGNLTRNATAGVATYSGCKITNGTNSGIYTLTATANGLTAGTSTQFTVAGTATKLVFTTQPTNTSTNTVFTTAPVVSIEDTNSDLVTNATNPVTLTIATGTGGTLSGCTTAVTATGGIATFNNCKITLTNGGTFSLKASATLSSAVTTTSTTFTVAGAATKLVFLPQPSSSATGGVAFATQPVVTVEDANNDVVTSNAAAVTLAITTGTGTSGAALTCTSNSPNAVAGVATFSGCAINLSGTGYTLKATQVSPALSQASTAITITVGLAAKLAFTTQPSASSANAATWAAQPVLTVQDAGGNKIVGATNTVSLVIGTQPGSEAILGCTTNPIVASAGVASFAGCQIVGTAGSYNLSATSPGLANGTSVTFSITAGAAAQVAFTTQPGGGANTVVWTTQPVVTVEDSGGNKTTGTTGVTLAIDQNAGGTLGCTHTTVTPVAGVATFAGCQITGTAGAYSLSASSTGLATGLSSAFSIAAGPASQVVFSTQPGGGGDGAAWATQPAVSIEDVSGNLVGTSTANVTLTIQSQPGAGATIGCTNNPLSATGGVASFAGCQITGTLGNYTLTAASTGLTSTNSASFGITVGSPAKLSFSTQPGSGVDGSALTTQPVVTVQDAGGNTVPTANNTVTLAIGTQPGTGAVLACTNNSVTANGGSASFAGCQITGKVGSYTLAATSSGLTSTTSSPPLTISAGLASKLAFTTQPGGGANGAVWTQQPIVAIQDIGGNTVVSNASVALAIATQPGTGAVLGCTNNSVNANAGVATFANCKITGKSGGYTLSAATTGLPTVNSNSLTITPGAATQLAFTTQPGGGSAGSIWGTQPVVTVEDQSGNVVNSNATVTLAIGSSNPGGTLTCTNNSVNANAGVASFTNCKIAGTLGSYNLNATATNLTTATSNNFNITVGAPAKLAFSTQPGGGANGAIWTAGNQPVVTIEDAGGNTVPTANNTVTLSIGTQPGTGAVLGCTNNSVTANAGVATFANCKITGKAGTTYTLSATATNLTTATSNSFTITAGAATQLAFSAQPGGGANAAVWTNQPAVSVEDQSGNVVTTANNTIALAIATQPGTGAVLGCTNNSVNANAGVATFANCKITGKTGTTYTLSATTTGGPTATTSAAFTITAGAASQLAFTIQPGGAVNGSNLSTQPVVSIEDASGNVVNSNATVTLAIGSSNPGGTLTCTNNSVNANAGVASFTNCKIAGTLGSYNLNATATNLTTATSNNFNITVGAPAKLAFSTQPGGGANGAIWTAGNQPVVTIEDAGGNTVPTANNTVTLSIGTQPGTGAVLGCTNNSVTANAGVATFANCKITGKAGTTYTLSATATNLTTATSNSFTITAGAATQLAFSAQPGGGANAAVWTNQPAVSVEDQSGNVVTTANNTIALAIATQPGTGAVLGCTNNSVNANAGVATFANCKITGKSGGYTLSAATTGLPTVNSNSLTITPGAATQLAFTTQPGGGSAGSIWGTQPVVTVEDQSGNVVNSNATVTLAIGSSNPGGTLTCTNNSVNANAGVASFTNCKIAGTLGSYNLNATATNLTTATSNNFNITVGAPAKLAFSTQPGGGANGAIWTAGNQPVVTIEDAGGNTVPTANNTVTLSIGTQPGTGAVLGCTNNSVTANAGVATFANCKITGKAGTTYTLSATATNLTTATSNSFTITAGAATQLAFSAQPGGGANAAVWTNQPAVSVEDQSGNVVTTANNTIALAIATQPGTGAVLGCTNNSVNANAGVATFANCKITGKTGTTYTLSATTTGGPTATTSAAFTITAGAASQLAFTIQPGNGVDGQSLSTQPVVSVEDQSGNVVNSNATVTLAIGSSNPGGTLACGTNPLNANAGVASFTNCAITGKLGTYNLTAAVSGLTTVTSSTFGVTIGGASQLAFTTPPGGGANGAIWTAGNQPVVTIEDAGGNTVPTANNTVTLSIGTQPGTGAVLACTNNSVNANAGVATFANCKITGKAGSYTLAGSTPAVPASATSTSFNISVGSASQLAFGDQPGGGANAAVWANQPVVNVEDSGGNVVTAATNTIALAIATQPGTGAVLGCTNNSVNANAGVATFANCKITGKAGTTYTLSATTTGGPTATTSAAFTITAGTATQLLFTTQPGNGVDGLNLATQPTVSIEDASGNVVNSNASVTLAIGSSNPGGTLACGTNPLNANAGVASFTNCAITGKLGTYNLTAAVSGVTTVTSNTFGVTIGGASQLAFTTPPGGGANGAIWTAGNQPVVTVLDVGGNKVTTATNTVTLSIATQPGTGAVLACTNNAVNANAGVATFANCKITGTAGGYTLAASSNVNVAGATSTQFNITFGTAAKLAFGVQPGGGANGSIWVAGNQPVVNIVDQSGNVVTTATNTITLAIATQPGTGAVLACTNNSVTATNGGVSFANCKITGKAGTTYTLSATTTGGPTATTSAAFTITAGTASQLAFTIQPGNGLDGSSLGTQPTVSIEDSSGNVVTGSNAAVTLAIGSSNPGGTLACDTNPLNANAGVASFTNCAITGKLGTYNLTAAVTGLTTVTSSTFSVTIGAASQLAFTAEPNGGANGVSWTTQPVVTVQDPGGNTVTTATNTIALAITTQPGTGAILGCNNNSVKAVNGIATFAGCDITGHAGSYTLSGSTVGGVITGANSTPFNITVGQATQLAFTPQPGNGTGSHSNLSTQPAVSIEDSGGNVVTTATNKITLAIGTSERTNSTLNVATNGLAAVNGVATFSGVSITHSNPFGQTTESGWTLTATAASLGMVTSSPFTT